MITTQAPTEVRCYCLDCVTERAIQTVRNADRGITTTGRRGDVAVGHDEDWHQTCESDDDCDRTVCLDILQAPHDGAVESPCLHGRALCDRHAGECVDCVTERRADGRW